VLVAILLAHDWRAIAGMLLEARFAILPVLAAHLFVTFAAAEGWRVLLAPGVRPSAWIGFRLRLIKEGVNALLPVAQVGGDVVRAQLAVGRRLALRTAVATGLVDVFVSLACLALFIIAGLAAAASVMPDPRIDRLAQQLSLAAAVVTLTLVAAERLGVLKLLDRAAAGSEGALGRLSGVGAEASALSRRPVLLASLGWHLVSWSLGVVETRAALWALGIETSWANAFVLESLAQGARALGFAVPGALGIQEGGYLLICSAIGIEPDKAVALSLIRRLRELILGAVGLGLWRLGREPQPGPEDAESDRGATGYRRNP
jgi:putative membrane protein